MPKARCSILTTSARFDLGDTVEMIPTLYRSAQRIFDYVSPEEHAQSEGDRQDDLYSLSAIAVRVGIDDLDDLFSDLQNDISDEWRIHFTDLGQYNYDIDTDDKILSINSQGKSFGAAIAQSHTTKNALMCTLIEGIRMVRHVEWIDASLETYRPKSIVQIGRYCMADTITQLIAATYKIKLMGYDGLWKTVLSGDHAFLAQEFANYIGTDTQNLDVLQQAMVHCFHHWFDQADKLAQCDHDSLSLMDSMLEDGIQLGHRKIEPMSVPCLTMVVGQNTSYIPEQFYQDIITNRYYTVIRHPVNKHHLKQIINENRSTLVHGIQFTDPVLASRFLLVD